MEDAGWELCGLMRDAAGGRAQGLGRAPETSQGAYFGQSCAGNLIFPELVVPGFRWRKKQELSRPCWFLRKNSAAGYCFRPSKPSERINSITVATPSPLFRLVNTNGRSPRMRFASCAMMSRLAPT